jgi:hypothetical protein
VCVCVCVCVCVDMYVFEVLCCLLVCMVPLTHVVITTRGFDSQACALIALILRVVFVFFVCLYNLVKEFIMCEGKLNTWNGKGPL